MPGFLQIHHWLVTLGPVKRWLAGLILLFVLAQTAGVVHAVAHPFHAQNHEHLHGQEQLSESFHGVSCDVFDNLAQPLDSTSEYLPKSNKPDVLIPRSIQVRSVFESPYQPAFFGRAPPIA